jgi:glucosyl-dolichyl phosphate glucuronosyltransferase
MSESLQISVVVGTRNRAPSLARLLNGLANQVNAPAFEVIVGDNGSSDHTSQVVRDASECLKKGYVRVERPGKSRALNAALKYARGELVVFTDDDVSPQPDWLATMHLASREYTDCNIFGGRIDVNIESVPKWIRRSFNLMGLLASAHNLGGSNIRYGWGGYPFGPNMAIRKNILAGMETPYPEHIGPGTALPTGDETGFFLQFSPPEAQDRLFVPSARVLHEVELENVAFKSAVKRCFLAGRASACLGMPAVNPRENGIASIPVVTMDRVRSCCSLQEFACITVRCLGYVYERYRISNARKVECSSTT